MCTALGWTYVRLHHNANPVVTISSNSAARISYVDDVDFNGGLSSAEKLVHGEGHSLASLLSTISRLSDVSVVRTPDENSVLRPSGSTVSAGQTC